MWQRVQTLYLLISTILIGTLFFCNKAGDDIRYVSYVPYAILLGIILILNILALTTWNFRIFQFRTSILTSLITFALQCWLAVDYFTADASLVFHVTAVFPVVCVILDVLAARNIFADELMVRSADRLRSAKRKRS